MLLQNVIIRFYIFFLFIIIFSCDFFSENQIVFLGEWRMSLDLLMGDEQGRGFDDFGELWPLYSWASFMKWFSLTSIAAVAEAGMSVDKSSFVRYDTLTVNKPCAVGTAPARTVLKPSPSMWVWKDETEQG